MNKAIVIGACFLLIFITGCSTGNNFTYGSSGSQQSTDSRPQPVPEPTQTASPEPTPTPQPTTTPTATPVTINGKILDLYGNPISGITVTGEGISTTTDARGEFMLDVPAFANSSQELTFQKQPYTIPSMPITFDGSVNPSYTSEIMAYIPFSNYGINSISSALSIASWSSTGYLAAISPDGKFLYTADRFGDSVTRLNLETNGFIVLKSGLNHPIGIAISSDGDSLYVSCAGGSPQNIRKISGIKDADSESDVTTVTILSGGANTAEGCSGNGAQLSDVQAIAISDDDSMLYVCDRSTNKIKIVTDIKTAQSADDTKVYTLISGLVDSRAILPYNLIISKDGDIIYLADSDNNRIIKIAGCKNAVASPAAVNAAILIPSISNPIGLALSGDEKILYTASRTAGLLKTDLTAPTLTAEPFRNGYSWLNGLLLYGDHTMYLITGGQSQGGNTQIHRITGTE